MSALAARLGSARNRPGLALAGLLALAAFVAVNVALAWVIIGGALDGEWYDFRDLGIAVQQLREGLDDRFDPWVSYVVTMVIGALGIISLVGGLLLILPWVERKLLARFQMRWGPNRVGPFGLLQGIADALKLMQKESVIPRGADLLMYFVPPMLMFLPGIVVWGPVPWGANMAYLDINVGVLYLIAMSSLSTLAVFLAGWSSNNHYALLGAMRTVAMMISYEIPLSLALLSVVLMTGTMQLSGIVAWQADHNLWLIALMPFALFCFLFSSTAELNRSPNDIAEAESEIVAGYFTEYSGIKAGLFMAVELGNAVAISALVSTFFLGGWTLFGLEEWIPGYLILASKISVLYFFFVWTRASLPRMRLDLLMGFAWKFLIPLALVQAFVVAVEAAVFARWDIEGIVPLGIFVVVNIAATVWAIRRWSDLLGYRPEPAPERRVLIAVEIGGLRAANRLHGGSSQGTR